jgi:hypothetical protein
MVSWLLVFLEVKEDFDLGRIGADEGREVAQNSFHIIQ